MANEQLFYIALVVLVVWTLLKWLRKRNTQQSEGGDQSRVDPDEVNTWFRGAQERFFELDDETKEEYTRAWDALSDEEKLKFSEEFIAERFSPDIAKAYEPEEKLRLGKAQWYLKPRF